MALRASVIALAMLATAVAFVSQAFALEPAPVIKFVYFVPSNIAFDPSAYADMKTTADDFAAWNRQYFQGNAPNYQLEYVLGDHTWEWYVYSREELNRVAPGWNLDKHVYFIAYELTRGEVFRKLQVDSSKDPNLKIVIFMHEYAASEDTSECASEGLGSAWMAFEGIQLVRTERTKTPLLLAHEVGHVWGLNHEGLPGDCMIGGFDNNNLTCNYSPSNQEKVLSKYGMFFTGSTGTNLGARNPPPVCTAKIGDSCSGSNGARSCCPADAYCQPLSTTDYQCTKRPTKCTDQLTDVDYPGNDIAQVQAASSGECCAICGQTPGCQAYSYYLSAMSGRPAGACYLKSLGNDPAYIPGAVSGVILADWSTEPCSRSVGDLCMKQANAIRSCCPAGSYCQPWAPDNYRCEAIPSQCAVQRMDTAYIGSDILVVNVSTPAQCCDACAQTPDCQAYTYYASSLGYALAGSCLLKNSADQQSRYTPGAVSGSVITHKPCQNKIGDSCSANFCCPSDGYCQPLGGGQYKCMKRPQLCAVLQTNVDYFGNDIKAVTVSSPEQCCDECSDTKGCNAYSYYNSSVPGRYAGACYLKSAAGEAQVIVGALSGTKITPGCPATIGDSCTGNNNVRSCCPRDGYCQPGEGNTYQCNRRPAKCAAPLTDMDYINNDIRMEYVSTPEECCNLCSATAGCKGYTYWATKQPFAEAGACYLKSKAETAYERTGAIAGSIL